jgi:hypothetical protein
VNECSIANNCSAAATCIDLVGSFTCQCNPGYAGDGFNCTDVDGPPLSWADLLPPLL